MRAGCEFWDRLDDAPVKKFTRTFPANSVTFPRIKQR